MTYCNTFSLYVVPEMTIFFRFAWTVILCAFLRC